MLPCSARSILAALSLAAFSFIAHPAQAQAIYSNRTIFNAANSNLTSFNFSNIAPLYGSVPYMPTDNKYGFSFSQPANSSTAGLYVIDSNFYANYALDGTSFLEAADGSPTQINIALPTGTTAFGADFGTLDSVKQVEVLVNGTALPMTFSASTSDAGSFFGYSSLTAINSLSFIEQTGDNLNLNDVEFSQGISAAPVPEASSALSLSLLLCLGLGSAACGLRKKKSV